MANWKDYLDDEQSDGTLTTSERDSMEEKYDGYQMLWGFDSQDFNHTDEDAVDAGCISSTVADGGFCAGVTYKGSSTRTAEIWAQWSTQQQFDDFVTNKKLDGHDDVEQWETEQTSPDFNGLWNMYRWLPKYEFRDDLYDNEYRFTPDTQ